MKYKVFKKSVVVERFPKRKCDIHTYIHTYMQDIVFTNYLVKGLALTVFGSILDI